jgi:hypothetical protein
MSTLLNAPDGEKREITHQVEFNRRRAAAGKRARRNGGRWL